MPINGNYVDIRNFGALPSNADNTNFIQQAIDSIAPPPFGTGMGGAVFIPDGVFTCSNINVGSALPISVRSGVRLIGSGWSGESTTLGSILKLDPNITPPPAGLLDFPNGSSGMENLALVDTAGKSTTAVVKGSAPGLNFRNFHIFTSNATVPAFLLQAGADRCYVTSGRINNQTGPAAVYEGIFDCITTAVRMIGGTTVFEHKSTSMVGGGAGNQFIGCRLSGIGTGLQAVATLHVAETLWAGSILDNAGSAGIILKFIPLTAQELVDGTSFTGCLFRNTNQLNTLPAVLIDSTAGSARDINFTGCRTRGQGPTNVFAYFVRIVGANAAGIIIDALTARDCKAFFDSAQKAPARIANSIIFDSSTGTRYQSEARGQSVQSGQMGKLNYAIPHGLKIDDTTKAYATAVASSDDARRAFKVTIDATNVIIGFAAQPPTGTSNLSWYWEARTLA